MGTATVVDEAGASSVGGDVSREELRAVLDRTLTELNADEVRGPLLRAADLRLRLRFVDLNLVLDLAASEDPDRPLEWTFDGEPEWKPKFELTMDSETANGYLQGRESLPIGIARRRVRCRGDSRAAILYLPAARLIVDPYRRIVARDYPHLALS